MRSGPTFVTTNSRCAFGCGTTIPLNPNDVALVLPPALAAQEPADPLGGVAYWEGACRVRDSSGRTIGKAYLELTGYVGKLQEKFR